jgi:hypothetical protein
MEPNAENKPDTRAVVLEHAREQEPFAIGTRVQVKSNWEPTVFTVVFMHPELRRKRYRDDVYYTDSKGNIFASSREELAIVEERVGDQVI